MFSFRFFHVPPILTRSYCDRVSCALEVMLGKKYTGEIHIIGVDEDMMSRLNHGYRHKTGPTDILTFSYLKNPLDGGVVGEIYICPNKIRLYAKERGVSFREQFEYIIIHGLLHLLGYDHETIAEGKIMEALEKKIIATLRSQ